MKTKFNANWVFFDRYTPGMEASTRRGVDVHLPHNAVDLPLGYFDETSYQRAFMYQKLINWVPEFEGREISLIFDGAMADARVFLNGEQIAAHRDGYTPFEVRLTDLLKRDTNLLAVIVDGSENPEIPPFGGQIDYLTYAGLYRDVWLYMRDAVALGAVKIDTYNVLQSTKSLSASISLDNPQNMAVDATVFVEVLDAEGATLADADVPVDDGVATVELHGFADAQLWSIRHPTLYSLRIRLDADGIEPDIKEISFGFRDAQFTKDGFFLNGEKLHLRGLNRHQSFPYVGYAMGKRAQEKDAEILKHDLHCNVVRTSHYPQSPYFLDHCDRIGLLVVEEIPGWQHIGGAAWQAESVANVERMIRRDWNHPSIIMWGVRINESEDDHAFYEATNEAARRLDPGRARGGIRCIENSELLEDVYTMNDFFHAADDAFRGNRPPAPLRTPREVTGLAEDVPYLVTEFNGHMFPTKITDSEVRQDEHVMRYLDVLNRAYGQEGISGSIGWCMFDYNTHKDFGSGDRICHHGVLDMFRIPKFASWVYRSQVDPGVEPVLKPVTYWARGEREIGGVYPLIILTNCDYVDMQFGDGAPIRVYPERERFAHLPYAPVIIGDHNAPTDQLGAWGRVWEDGVFVGYVDHVEVARVVQVANPVPQKLDIVIDSNELSAEDRDEVIVHIRALDQAGQVMPYLDDVIYLELSGPASILGPEVLPLRAGQCGFWMRASGDVGEINLTAFSQRIGVSKRSLLAM